MRTALAVLLTGLSAFGELSPVSNASPAKTERFEYRDDIQAFIRRLPDLFREDEKLVRILAALAAGYPKEFQELVKSADQRLFICLVGQKFIYDDGVTKTFEQRLDHPDIEDMFCQTYPLANPIGRLPKDFDPGRYRAEALYLALYGESEAAVVRNCITVDFCGHAVKFNRRCGAADALRAVSADLMRV